MNAPEQHAAARQALLEKVREAAQHEHQVKIEAPMAAKREAAERIGAATERKIAAMVEARAAGATLAAIAAQLGTSNLSQVSKLIRNAEGKQ